MIRLDSQNTSDLASPYKLAPDISHSQPEVRETVYLLDGTTVPITFIIGQLRDSYCWDVFSFGLFERRNGNSEIRIIWDGKKWVEVLSKYSDVENMHEDVKDW